MIDRSYSHCLVSRVIGEAGLDIILYILDRTWFVEDMLSEITEGRSNVFSFTFIMEHSRTLS